MNWYAPTFLTVGANTVDINSIQLDDGGIMSVGWGDNMQVVGPLGNPESIYLYLDPSLDPTGQATTYFWADANYSPVAVSFEAGDGIAIDNAGELQFNIQNAGQVPSGKVTVPARPFLNWLGNPFPAPININAIQLNDGGTMSVGWGDNMQIVGALGNPETIYLYLDPSLDPTGEAKTYFWADANYSPVNVTLEPGAGFAIDNAGELTFDIEIACPY